jgi:hypothetical protein
VCEDVREAPKHRIQAGRAVSRPKVEGWLGSGGMAALVHCIHARLEVQCQWLRVVEVVWAWGQLLGVTLDEVGEQSWGCCCQDARSRDKRAACASHWAENPAVPAILRLSRRLIGS